MGLIIGQHMQDHRLSQEKESVSLKRKGEEKEEFRQRRLRKEQKESKVLS